MIGTHDLFLNSLAGFAERMEFAMKQLDSVVKAVEQFDFLDGISSSLAKAVGKAVDPRPVRNLLSGTVIGHPLHPVLTDLPIGAWTMAALLDLAGGRSSEPAADLLVIAGIATAVPTAAAGLNDWSDTEGKTQRTGIVHAWQTAQPCASTSPPKAAPRAAKVTGG